MTTELTVDLTSVNPVTVFAQGGLDELIKQIEAEAKSVVPDMSTAKGRKEIASNAAKVARSKTYLDGLGKDLVADRKKELADVDAERRSMRSRLDSLRDEIRKPLTEWEQAGKTRIAGIKSRIAEDFTSEMPFPTDGHRHTSMEISARISKIESIVIYEDKYAEFVADAAIAKDAGLSDLREALTTTRQREYEEIQRKETDARERKEREERIAKEAAERAKRETEEKASQEARQQELEKERALRQAEEAKRKAIESEQRREREAAAAEQRERQAVERATQHERDRIEAQQRGVQAELANRNADRNHKMNIHREIQSDLLDAGYAVKEANQIISLLVKRHIRHVTINY